MKTYEDLLEITNEEDLRRFVYNVVSEYKGSEEYRNAVTASEYMERRNVTIMNYQKLLYKLSGEAVPDNFSANYKFCNAFFPMFVKQEVSYLLGNGITFNEESTKDKLGGKKFDTAMMKAGKMAIWGGIAYGFLNLDHIDVFSALEFVPLWGEEDGGLHAGIRFWQISADKPLRATLYEADGYTEYIYRRAEREEKPTFEVLKEKRPYIQVVRETQADGAEIIDGRNYPGFPIIPLYANDARQSEFEGLQEKLDGYDLIQSGFANDLDDASQIYWTIKNAGGMDDIDLAKFIERMKVVKAAVVDDDGSQAEAHTIDVPYEARMQALQEIRNSLYNDAMAVDMQTISQGNITATAIQGLYTNLDLKTDDFENCVNEFIYGLLDLLGIDDAPSYKRNKVVNVAEETQVILSAASYLDDRTILEHLPFLSPDEIESILEAREKEDMERYADIEDRLENIERNQQTVEVTENDTEAVGERNNEDISASEG